MRQATHTIKAPTRGRGLYNINRKVVEWVKGLGMRTGLLTVFIPHTSASLVIQENADPDVLQDLNEYLNRLVMDGDPAFRHTQEGPDDMAAHIRSALTQTQLSIPLLEGRLSLGAWQDIYLFEHRTSPHERRVILHLSGE